MPHLRSSDSAKAAVKRTIYLLGNDAIYTHYQEVFNDDNITLEQYPNWDTLLNKEIAQDALNNLKRIRPNAAIIYMPGASLNGQDVGLNVLLPFLKEIKALGIKAIIAETISNNSIKDQITAAGGIIISKPDPTKVRAALLSIIDVKHSARSI